MSFYEDDDNLDKILNLTINDQVMDNDYINNSFNNLLEIKEENINMSKTDKDYLYKSFENLSLFLTELIGGIRENNIKIENINLLINKLSDEIRTKTKPLKTCLIHYTDNHIFIKGNREKYGLIIGKAGNNIKYYENRYKVKIYVPCMDERIFDYIYIEYKNNNYDNAIYVKSEIIKILNG